MLGPQRSLLTVTKSAHRSSVHRPSYLDVIGVARRDADGVVVGAQRTVGLFASSAYSEAVRRTPMVRRKVAAALARSGFGPTSHDGRDLLACMSPSSVPCPSSGHRRRVGRRGSSSCTIGRLGRAGARSLVMGDAGEFE